MGVSKKEKGIVFGAKKDVNFPVWMGFMAHNSTYTLRYIKWTYTWNFKRGAPGMNVLIEVTKYKL